MSKKMREQRLHPPYTYDGLQVFCECNDPERYTNKEERQGAVCVGNRVDVPCCPACHMWPWTYLNTPPKTNIKGDDMKEKADVKEDALEGSIEKWEKIINKEGVDYNNCPLCEEDCNSCVVHKVVGQRGCNNTPYEAWKTHHNQAHPNHPRIDRKVLCPVCEALATAEYEFLKSLRVEKPEWAWVNVYNRENGSTGQSGFGICLGPRLHSSQDEAVSFGSPNGATIPVRVPANAAAVKVIRAEHEARQESEGK